LPSPRFQEENQAAESFKNLPETLLGSLICLHVTAFVFAFFLIKNNVGLGAAVRETASKPGTTLFDVWLKLLDFKLYFLSMAQFLQCNTTSTYAKSIFFYLANLNILIGQKILSQFGKHHTN